MKDPARDRAIKVMKEDLTRYLNELGHAKEVSMIRSLKRRIKKTAAIIKELESR